MMEITSFDKTKLKKTETREKNPLPTKENLCGAAKFLQVTHSHATKGEPSKFACSHTPARALNTPILYKRGTVHIDVTKADNKTSHEHDSWHRNLLWDAGLKS
ncbi:hypothetical protein P4O66_016612 [Electrophorus voltai]|uniref:Uncharacterized protein n=1 Tax=Electrophorus voltai TaxID=2609070 RepID=A0AAD9DPN9_9TELE|nr:hypothetical protein P4O66_016612 [Electrophorus voltai]